MSKPTYDELQDLINRIYKATTIESALGCEWANYPVEIFNEVVDAVTLTIGELDE